MKKEFVGEMLSEKGDISLMRVMALSCVAVSSIIAIYGVYSNRDLIDISALCAVFLGAAFTGKVSQKFMEKK